MNKYERAIKALNEGNEHTMKVFGQSMKPIIESGSSLTFRKTDDYRVGDVVLSKVKGRWIDAHKITKVDAGGRFMIANNHGWENGWTKNVFGRVIAVNGKPFGRSTENLPSVTPERLAELKAQGRETRKAIKKRLEPILDVSSEKMNRRLK